jgi:hypothetical protein
VKALVSSTRESIVASDISLFLRDANRMQPQKLQPFHGGAQEGACTCAWFAGKPRDAMNQRAGGITSVHDAEAEAFIAGSEENQHRVLRSRTAAATAVGAGSRVGELADRGEINVTNVIKS